MSTAEVLDESTPTLDAEGLTTATIDDARDRTTGKFFYGWLMLPLAMLMMIATSPGQTFGFTFFNAKFREAFELTQTGLSTTYLVATVLASVALPYIGALTDRHGLRRSSLVTVMALVSVCLFISQAQGIVTLFLSFLMFRIIGPGTLVLLANNTLARWFDRRLGMASGMMQVAMAGAHALVPGGMVLLIATFGWRGAYLSIASILAVSLLPLLFFAYRESPATVGQFPDGDTHLHHDQSRQLSVRGLTLDEARLHASFWIMLAATATWAMIGTGFVFHLDAIFQARGFDSQSSTAAMRIMATAMATAQLLGGALADRIALRWLIVTAVGIIATTSVMLALGRADLLLPAFAVYGIAQGLMSIIAATGWARYFGRAHLGKIRGVSLTAAIAGSSLGPLMLAVSDDYLGDFAPSLWLFAVIAGVTAVAGFWATPPEGNDEIPNDE